MLSWLWDLITSSRQAPAAEGICFVAGTPVWTPDGWRAIEELQPGDLVWSRDEQTGEVGLRPIDRTFVTPDADILEVSTQSQDGVVEKIRSTPSHPYRVEDRWVRASDLTSGDVISSADGQSHRVVGVHHLDRPETVYNIEVHRFHTYFVGQGKLWVHNACQGGPLRGIGGSGWRGDANWRSAVRDVNRGGTIESLNGTVPTKQEAIDLINEGGGSVERIEGPHDAPNPHNYPHVNYWTSEGAKGTLRILGL